VMGHSRVEGFARALARAAGYDPDELIDDVEHDPFRSTRSCPARIPAWQRFKCAAENACVIHGVLSERSRTMPMGRQECTDGGIG
jgi:hypothetical protein